MRVATGAIMHETNAFSNIEPDLERFKKRHLFFGKEALSFFKGTKTKAYYLIAGSAAYDVIQLTGFDELKAIPGGAVAVSDEDLKTAAELLPRPADPAKPAAR